MLLTAAYVCDRGLDPIVYAAMYLGPDAERRLLAEDFVQDSIQRFVLFSSREGTQSSNRVFIDTT